MTSWSVQLGKFWNLLRREFFIFFKKFYLYEIVQGSTKEQRDGPDDLTTFFPVPEFYYLINIKIKLFKSGFNFW